MALASNRKHPLDPPWQFLIQLVNLPLDARLLKPHLSPTYNSLCAGPALWFSTHPKIREHEGRTPARSFKTSPTPSRRFMETSESPRKEWPCPECLRARHPVWYFGLPKKKGAAGSLTGFIPTDLFRPAQLANDQMAIASMPSLPCTVRLRVSRTTSTGMRS